jgi:hypothetical protein
MLSAAVHASEAIKAKMITEAIGRGHCTPQVFIATIAIDPEAPMVKISANTTTSHLQINNDRLVISLFY